MTLANQMQIIEQTLVTGKLVDLEKIDFNTIPLNKPINKNDLSNLSLAELENGMRILIKRAANVIGEIAALKSSDEHSIKQFSSGLFRSEHKDDQGNVLFRYSCEHRPEIRKHNTFTPGEWFTKFLDELETLRIRKAENVNSFSVNEKNRLISQLTKEVAA